MKINFKIDSSKKPIYTLDASSIKGKQYELKWNIYDNHSNKLDIYIKPIRKPVLDLSTYPYGQYVINLQVKDSFKNITHTVVKTIKFIKPEAKFTYEELENRKIKVDASKSLGKDLKYYWEVKTKLGASILSSENSVEIFDLNPYPANFFEIHLQVSEGDMFSEPKIQTLYY